MHFDKHLNKHNKILPLYLPSLRPRKYPIYTLPLFTGVIKLPFSKLLNHSHFHVSQYRATFTSARYIKQLPYHTRCC